MRGLFITLEGPDGSGKTTLLQMLHEALEEKKIAHILTREPGGTVIGEKIRDIILDVNHKELSHRGEALLYAASRAQLVEELIRPTLEKGIHVLCDRFVLSSLAYQGRGRNLGINNIRDINAFATGEIRPDITLFLKVDPLVTLKRKFEGDADRMELEGDGFHRAVYEGYMEILQMYSKDLTVVDANRPVEKVFEESLHIITERLGELS